MAEPERTSRAPVKITDVAAAAGVAPMTVSRVINTPDRVSPETAARVRAAIEKLGYVPNLIAGGLSSRRSRMVAAIVPTIAHPMFAGMVQSFTDTMRDRLRAYGLFSEIISWKLRMFVPTDATGAGVLAKVLDHYPALRIGEREAA